MTDRIIESAKNVLLQEIKGLEAIIDGLDQDFVDAVELLDRVVGRVIVSGMGKSGHVARKIAATMASTGTPAMFVHPAEASHGDLGMIGKDDAVILLSNSGETAELGDIIHYCKRFSIPLIGIARRKSSTLVDAATIAFVLPDVPEASPVDAPTTSTTMMLAWGDALAVALLEKRGFTKEHFAVYHPGGKLGSQLMKVGQLMRVEDELPMVTLEMPMSEALIIMTAKSMGCVAVVDDDERLKGIVTDGDLRRHMSDDLTKKTAETVMTGQPITIAETMLAVEALNIMNTKNITTLCVTAENGRLLGIVHIHDLLSAGVS